MKCPYCGKEMENGYIQCRDGVTWTPKRQPIAALSAFGRGSIALGKEEASCAPACKCSACRKIILEYEPQ